MFKKSWFFVLLLCLLSLSTSFVQAKSDESEEETQRLEMKKKTEEKKLELNGTKWQITVASQGGKGTLPPTDTLTFQNGQFISESLSEKGFSATNYTLTIQENGPTIWETMQTGPKGLITFWRGEWKDESMNGIINRRLPEDKSEEYSFSSSQKTAIPPSTEPAEKTEESAAPLPNDVAQSSVLGALPETSEKSIEESRLLSFDNPPDTASEGTDQEAS